LTPNSIDKMTLYEMDQLVRCIEPLEAQEGLIALKVSHYPHLSKQDKSRVHKWFMDKSYSGKRDQKMLSAEAAAKMLGQRGLNG